MLLTDADLPALFQAADEAAKTQQRRYVTTTAATLLAAIVAATFGAVSIESGGREWAAAAATVSFVIGLLLAIYLLWDRPERQWYDARAAAESVKTLAWRYAVGGTDFQVTGDHAAADRELLGRLSLISRSLDHVSLAVAGGEQITPGMRELRRAKLEVRRDVYRQCRLKDQRDWYTAAAKRNNRRALQWRFASLGAQMIGIVGGILRTTETIHFDLLGIAAAASAAVLAWLQTRDHVTLAEAYAVTARELSLADEQARAAAEDEWPTSVDDAEAAISREHTLWRARRSSLEV